MATHSRVLSSLLALTPVSALAAQQAALPFDAPQVAFHNSTSITTLGDFDGDGDPDAAGWYWQYYRNFHSARIKIYRNDGTGQFAITPFITTLYSSTPSTPTPDWDSESGDIDGDQVADLLFSMGNEVCIWRSPLVVGTRVARWTEASSIVDTVLYDADGDGLDDVALVTGNELRLYHNTPSGFVLHASQPASGQKLMVGELDTVPGPDLWLGSNDVDSLWNGTTLQPITTLTHGVGLAESPMHTLGDVDGDGDADGVVFSEAGQFVTLRQTAPGQWSIESREVGGPATGLADIDGDGDLDGVCCGGGGPTPAYNNMASVYHVSENRGGGSFAPARTMNGLGAFRLAGAEDVDNDGDLDLVGGRTIWFNRGMFLRDSQPKLPYSTNRPFRDLSDLDADGDVDFQEWPNVIWQNNGDGEMTRVSRPMPAAPPGTWFRGEGFRGDFDGDGDEDLIVGHADSQTVLGMRLLENRGGQLFDAGYAAQGVTFSHAVSAYEFGPLSVVTDIDGDGDLDIAQGHTVGFIQVVTWWNDGNGRFTRGPFTWSYPPVKAADVDGDGHMDLVTTDGVRFGVGDGTFSNRLPGISLISDIRDTDRVAVADLDGNGHMDLAFSSVRNHWLEVRWNMGNRVFQTGSYHFPLYPNSFDPRSVHADDVNGDGNLDLIAYPGAWQDGALSTPIYLGDGQQGFAAPIVQIMDARNLIDVDGDGLRDAVGEMITRRAHPTPRGSQRVQMGTATPGTGGIAPTLGASGPITAGIDVELRLVGAAGGSLMALGFGGTQATTPDFPMPGMTSYVALPVTAVVAICNGSSGEAGAGDWRQSVPVPASMAGTEVWLQGWVWDTGAATGIAQTNGLMLRFE